MKSPKAPKPTAQELAGVARQSRMIDEETEQLEKRLKATARGKLGSKSLLAKASSTASSKASGKASGTARSSMIGGGINFSGFGR
tara:strand:+ start:734 stop:988 length:255 start_codon:yes stop_codon:yes gene_type:complete